MPETAAPVEVVRLPQLSPAAAFADLRSRGVAALLTEGGPTLNSALLGAGLVDELFLTIAPLITGEADAIRIVEGDGLASRCAPARCGCCAPAASCSCATRSSSSVRPCGSRERARSSRAAPAGWARRRRGGCAAGGAKVTIADLNAEAGQALADELGAAFVACDVTDEAQVQAAVGGRRGPADLGLLRRHRLGGEGRGQARRARARAVPEGDRRQPDRHLQRAAARGRRDARQRARRGRRVRRDRQHRLDRRLRRPDRPDRLLGVQGRRGRDDAAGRARPRVRARSGSARSRRGCSTRRCWRASRRRPARRSGRRSRTPRASASPTSTAPSPPTSSRTRCSTARSSASTARCGCRRARHLSRPH